MEETAKRFKKKTSKDLNILWKIGQSLWKKDSSSFNREIENKEFSNDLKPFIFYLKDEVRNRNEELISIAYQVISLSHCAELLSLTKQQTVEHVTKLKWVIEGDFVLPRRPTTNKQQETSLAQLNQLTTYMTHLEEK